MGIAVKYFVQSFFAAIAIRLSNLRLVTFSSPVSPHPRTSKNFPYMMSNTIVPIFTYLYYR